MKCEYCGANLQIEDAKCPHCGRETPHYIKHRSDMQAYQADYQSTKQEVLENASKLNRRNVHITVIAILVALCAVAAAFCFFSDDIRYAREEREIARNRSVYEAQIRTLMEEGAFMDLHDYANRNHISYTDAFHEYTKVFSVSMYATFCYRYTMEFVTEGVNEKYETLDERCGTIARQVRGVYDARKRESYDKDEYFTADKTAFMDETVKKTELLLKAYFGLTDKEIAALPDLSEARIAVLLAEGVENEK